MKTLNMEFLYKFMMETFTAMITKLMLPLNIMLNLILLVVKLMNRQVYILLQMLQKIKIRKKNNLKIKLFFKGIKF
jgi:hypothetical protein